jgi:Ca2+-binding EF-hand superfamily protein
MSLQVMHRAGKMSKGSERKMTVQEFEILCNNAWKFLKVTIPSGTAKEIFNDADKDRDGLITYVEYFQFIEKHICQSKAQYEGKVEQPKPVEPPKKDEGPERFSRLRRWIWEYLLRLYNAYVNSRTLSVNDKELRGLVIAILGDLSEAEITFLLNGLFKLTDKTILFEPFAMIFIYLVAELGLSRYSKNHNVSVKTLNKDEFVILFRNSFKVFEVSRIRVEFLWRVFAKIDKNNDGLISFEEYLDWVKRFLAVLKYFGDEFWVYPDDDINSGLDNFLIKDKPIVEPIKPKEKFSYIRFQFSNYDFAMQVRKRMYDCLVPFDRNRDK